MIKQFDLLQWIERLHNSSVMVVGDVMLDRFIYGDVSRISPEGPVPILKSIEMRAMLGGAGNVARNLAALGARTFLISTVGVDGYAEKINALLSQLPSVEPHLIPDPKRMSTVKTRFMSKQQQLLRVDSESSHYVDDNVISSAIAAIQQCLPLCDAVIFSDYGKGFLARSLLQKSIELCRNCRKPALVDPKGLDYSIYANASLITPNLKELGEAVKMRVDDDESVVRAARKLIDDCRLDAVLATRSQDGMSLIQASGEITHLRAAAREVFDVTGAGDTVIAVMSAAIAAGAPLAECAEMANVAAGIVVGKTGTAVARTADIIHAIRRRELSTAESKICDLASAIDRIDRWKRKDAKVGFMNGFFELLHPHHVKLVSNASKQCDRLIIGINGDASITRLKGENPLIHEAARSSMVASLEDVDMVVLFNEDTPAKLIELLKPDVVFKKELAAKDAFADGFLFQTPGEYSAVAVRPSPE